MVPAPPTLLLTLTTTTILILTLSPSTSPFTPPDNYLIDCGSTINTNVTGRTFTADDPTTWTLTSTNTTTLTTNTTTPSPLYNTARVFLSTSSYTFPITQQGRHFIRLYFLPFTNPTHDLTQSNFSISTSPYTLLSAFNPTNTSTPIYKEYIVTITSTTLVLTFHPTSPGGLAFVNAIEVVSAPGYLFADTAENANSLGKVQGLNATAMETVYRVNMGGPMLSAANDTLWRNWVPDLGFLVDQSLANFTTYSGKIDYSIVGSSEQVAPPQVYRTATEMAKNSNVLNSNFNVTWRFEVDSSYTHFLRLHFCDIVSTSLYSLLFNVYINGFGVTRAGLDLSTLTSNSLAAPYYMDVVVSLPEGSGSLAISIGPSSSDRVEPNAILNGLEVMKMSNSLGSLDGSSSVVATGSSSGSSSKSGTTVIIGVVLAVCGVSMAVGVMLCVVGKRRKNEKKKKMMMVKRPSKNINSITLNSIHTNATVNSVAPNLGHAFSLAVLQAATDHFDESRVIGVGGFGKVYRGMLGDGTEVAVKRGNPRSQQGMTEFLTEIQLLSQLRHRHLVSLIGFCDEGGEMILVYEYMEKGTLRSHLYGSDLPPLNWKQRLEICIGAARGLHYLHTGQAKAIIHRDVKSANILLDADFVAKVADFGLSKAGPDLDKTHVSTAVKGSFGYLDPEYFRRQQLTQKSDVYSFGVVLLEVLCARPVIDPTLPRDTVNLAEWAMALRKRGELEGAIDERIVGTMQAESLEKFVETAEKCLAESGSRRPGMGDVLWNLEAALLLQERGGLNYGGSDSERDSVAAGFIGDESPLVWNLRSSERGGDAGVDGIGGGEEHDLPGLTMSRVFSQLVKNEGRY